MLDPLLKREWRRRATKIFRDCVSSFGSVLPRDTKLSLARRSTKFGHLLVKDGDFILPDYLDSFRVNINVKYTAERVMLTGVYEADLWWTIRNHVSPGDVCIDIGANVGAVSLFLAKMVGDGGRVLCFEPGPSYFQRLQKNIELNPQIQDRIEVFNLGLADKRGTLHWAEDPDFPGNAFMFGDEGTVLDVVRLDNLLACKLESLNFIKIDVEGMEFEVLKGAQEIIAKFKPKIFFETSMEFEQYRNAPIRKQASEWLKGLGYTLFRVTESKTLKKVEYPNFSQNTLALAQGPSQILESR